MDGRYLIQMQFLMDTAYAHGLNGYSLMTGVQCSSHWHSLGENISNRTLRSCQLELPNSHQTPSAIHLEGYNKKLESLTLSSIAPRRKEGNVTVEVYCSLITVGIQDFNAQDNHDVVQFCPSQSYCY